jgi:hypothetical protein
MWQYRLFNRLFIDAWRKSCTLWPSSNTALCLAHKILDIHYELAQNNVSIF